MTRFIYALKEIRACLEAEMLTDVQRDWSCCREIGQPEWSRRPLSADFRGG